MLKKLADRLLKSLRTALDLDEETEDVNALHTKFGILTFNTPGHLTQRKLKERIDFLQEELTEFKKAAAEQDIEDMLDALVDLVYVAKGTALMLGFRKVWKAAWREVQRANMSKVRGVGPRGHRVDLVKPAGWVGPSHFAALAIAGYDPMTLDYERDDIEELEARGEA